MYEQLIVIIDDEEDLLDLYEYNFSKQGYRVVTFTRALQAIDFIRHNRPSIILCDWMMPELNGLDFCKRLKCDLTLADIPLVMVTCRNEQSAVRQALAAGATDFISKPIGLPALLHRIEFLLAHQPMIGHSRAKSRTA